MDSHALRKLMVNLDESLVITTSRKIVDTSLLSRHAFYLAAYHLAKRGHVVQVLDERERKGSDLFLPNGGVRVEVKHAIKRADGSCILSLGSGSSLRDHGFDYLVAVIYGRERPDEEHDAYIFTHDELYELLGAGKGATRGFASQPYSLYFSRDYPSYRKKLARDRMPRTRVEDALNSAPEAFLRAWEKVALVE